MVYIEMWGISYDYGKVACTTTIKVLSWTELYIYSIVCFWKIGKEVINVQARGWN